MRYTERKTYNYRKEDLDVMLGSTRPMDGVTERCMMNTQVLEAKPTDGTLHRRVSADTVHLDFQKLKR